MILRTVGVSSSDVRLDAGQHHEGGERGGRATPRRRDQPAAPPSRYSAFDLLVGPGGDRLVDPPLSKRRAALEHFFAALEPTPPALELSPAVTDVDAARRWLDDIGTGLDGVIAKRRALPYASGERDAMVKYKTQIGRASCRERV